jgi:hypothetical protein
MNDLQYSIITITYDVTVDSSIGLSDSLLAIRMWDLVNYGAIANLLISIVLRTPFVIVNKDKV